MKRSTSPQVPVVVPAEAGLFCLQRLQLLAQVRVFPLQRLPLRALLDLGQGCHIVIITKDFKVITLLKLGASSPNHEKIG